VSLTIELTDMMLPGVSDVILNKDDDLIFLTVGMYKLFLSKAGGGTRAIYTFTSCSRRACRRRIRSGRTRHT